MDMNLGARFKRFRIKAGLKQTEAADKIGVKYYQLGNYETNRSEPSIAVLKKMSEAYHVSIDQLVYNVNSMKKNTAPFTGDNENIELDDLLKSLNEMVDKVNSIKKSN